MSVGADVQADGRVIPMTEEALMRLLNEARNGGGYLPPGAYRDAVGVVYRDVKVPTGRVREWTDEAGRVRRQQILRTEKRLVMLVGDPSPPGLVETAKRCKRTANEHGPDFYHPEFGWVRGGTKREVDVPANLGTGAERFEMTYADIEAEETLGTSSATMQGVPVDHDDDAPPSDLAPFGGAGDGAAHEPAAQGRRKGG